MNKLEYRIDKLFRSLNIDQRKTMFDYLAFQSKTASDKDKELIAQKINQLLHSTSSDQLWLFNHFMFDKFKKILEEDIKTNHPIRKALVLENLRLRLFLDIHRHHGLYKDCLLVAIRISHDLSKEEWDGFVKFIGEAFKEINKGNSEEESAIDPIRLHMLMEKLSSKNQKKIEKLKNNGLKPKCLELLHRQDWIESAGMDSFIRLVVLLDQYLVLELGRDRLFQFDIISEFESLAEGEKGIRSLIADYLKALDCDEGMVRIAAEDCFPFSATIEVLDKFSGEMNGQLGDMLNSIPELEEVKKQMILKTNKDPI